MLEEKQAKKCKICGKQSKFIASFLEICGECAKEGSVEARKVAEEIHQKAREEFGLPPKPPRDLEGVECGICANQCKIGENKKGFCGLVENREGRLFRLAGTPEKGLLEAYLDPHPTNCVASWCCAGGSEAGYPKYSMSKGPEYDYYNLSVFYGACNFDCLYCQNWHFRSMVGKGPFLSASELASQVKEKVTCICFFGGDPAPQIQHALATAKLARQKKKGILRVCLETNGNLDEKMLHEFAQVSLESGGGIKFDLKCWNENLSLVLSGVSNQQAFKNLKKLAKLHEQRPEVPFLRASTLLVPGYVDEEEVEKIASFLAKLDSTIPYSLLAFSPQYLMDDLPFTSREFAYRCKKIAEEAGLQRVRIGNEFILA